MVTQKTSVHFHNEQLRILKDLFLQYQKEEDKNTFCEIVKRTDKLLIALVGRFSRKYYFSEPSPQILQDMYQVSVQILKKAVLDFNPDKNEGVIPFWIFYIVRNELFRVYGIRKFDSETYLYEHPDCVEKPEIDFNLINEDIQKIVADLILSKKISSEDFILFSLIWVQKIPITKIMKEHGNRWGKSWITLKNRSLRTKKILKEEFERKGF